MNKKSNNNLVLRITLLIVVIFLLLIAVLGNFNMSDTTSDIIIGGFALIVAVVTYLSFHLKEKNEIAKSKTTKESMAKTFNYYSRNVKYFQKVAIITLVLYAIYEIKNLALLENISIETFPFQLITTLVTSIVSIVMLGELRKFFDNSATIGTPFNKENSKLLNNISVLFSIALLVNHTVLSLAMFIFVEVISTVFKLGVELQEENDNTI